jgi:hypothetical protein
MKHRRRVEWSFASSRRFPSGQSGVPTPGGDNPADLGHHRFDEIRCEKLHAGLTICGCPPPELAITARAPRGKLRETGAY